MPSSFDEGFKPSEFHWLSLPGEAPPAGTDNIAC